VIYNAQLSDDSVNISQESFLSQAIKLIISLLLFVGVFYILMVGLINLIVANITPKQEKQLLEYISFEINISNKESTYLTKVKDKLEACTNIPYNVKIYISEEKIANAYALPGGTIYITQGMLEKFENQNELAFIIGHELGHFTNKDHLKGIGHSLILLTLATLMGSDFNILGQTLSAGGAKYSQSAELHADKVGLELMNCAYGSVTDATRIFEKMGRGESDWKFFLASHPNFKDRVTKMKEIITKQNMDNSKKAIALENF